MNKELTTAANFTLGGGSYESPAVSVVEVISEGVLCASNGLSVTPWENDEDFSW